MRLLLDEDVYGVTATFLRRLGHDVVAIVEEGLAGAPDERVLAIAAQEDRVLITRDKGYGALVYLRAQPSSGIVLLRIDHVFEISAVHSELRRVLEQHTEGELHRSFAIVEPGRYRLRRLDEPPI